MENIVKKVLILLYFATGFLLTWENAVGQTNDPLQFPKDNFTIETKTVKTSTGDKKVTYHSFMHITYVAKPVDKDFQSLNISVPVEIDGKTIDAKNAPIFFDIAVGGYMSVRNNNSSVIAAEGGIQVMTAGGRGGVAGNASSVSGRPDLALAAGFVIVSPGCRGRDNKAADGTYYGKAPAAIVDLKAAVRYLRYNKGVIPGNTDRIISVGCSAGGALSALLGASGNSPLYDLYLKEIGAANVPDNIYASACYSPITDLEHADGAYEWNYGTIPGRAGLVDQKLSAQLKASFGEYQESLMLKGKNGFGIITAENYDRYLLQYFLIPSANKYLNELTEEKRKEYLAINPWISWSGKEAVFSFPDYVNHVGRMKALPAFDDFNNQQPEPDLFGNKTIKSRHFTNFSLRQSTGNMNAQIDSEVQTLVNMMNPMYFIGQKNSGCAVKWWLRNGTKDNDTSQPIMVNLATSLENNLSRDVNVWDFWDGGHCQDQDPEGLISWMGSITGYNK
jgi:hypothetical protein